MVLFFRQTYLMKKQGYIWRGEISEVSYGDGEVEVRVPPKERDLLVQD
jgi:hypothetical protein